MHFAQICSYLQAFCLLLLYSYYANNFAGKIDASLLAGWLIIFCKSIQQACVTIYSLILPIHSQFPITGIPNE